MYKFFNQSFAKTKSKAHNYDLCSLLMALEPQNTPLNPAEKIKSIVAKFPYIKRNDDGSISFDREKTNTRIRTEGVTKMLKTFYTHTDHYKILYDGKVEMIAETEEEGSKGKYGDNSMFVGNVGEWMLASWCASAYRLEQSSAPSFTKFNPSNAFMTKLMETYNLVPIAYQLGVGSSDITVRTSKSVVHPVGSIDILCYRKLDDSFVPVEIKTITSKALKSKNDIKDYVVKDANVLQVCIYTSLFEDMAASVGATVKVNNMVLIGLNLSAGHFAAWSIPRSSCKTIATGVHGVRAPIPIVKPVVEVPITTEPLVEYVEYGKGGGAWLYGRRKSAGNPSESEIEQIRKALNNMEVAEFVNRVNEVVVNPVVEFAKDTQLPEHFLHEYAKTAQNWMKNMDAVLYEHLWLYLEGNAHVFDKSLQGKWGESFDTNENVYLRIQLEGVFGSMEKVVARKTVTSAELRHRKYLFYRVLRDVASSLDSERGNHHKYMAAAPDGVLDILAISEALEAISTYCVNAEHLGNNGNAISSAMNAIGYVVAISAESKSSKLEKIPLIAYLKENKPKVYQLIEMVRSRIPRKVNNKLMLRLIYAKIRRVLKAVLPWQNSN